MIRPKPAPTSEPAPLLDYVAPPSEPAAPPPPVSSLLAAAAAALAPEANGDGAAIDERRPQLALFEVAEPWRDLWRGMPEFAQRDLTPIKTIYVHFETRADLAAFARLVEQTITMETRSIWYPEGEVGRYADKRFVDGPAAPAAPDPYVDDVELADEEAPE